MGLGDGGRGEAGFSAGQPHPRSRGDSAGPLASHTRFSRSPLPTQVWFKNRRAQRSRLERRQAQGGYQMAGDAPTDPGAPGTPAPAPESAAAAANPNFPDSPGFYSRPPPPSPAGVLPAPEPGISSHHPATWGPAQGVHVYGPTASTPAPAPAPAPGWPQDPDAPNYCPDPLPVLLPDCARMFSFQELFSKPSSPLKSVSPVDKDDLGSQRFTNLQGRGHPSPQSPADPEGPERTRAL